MLWLPVILILPYFFLILKICRDLRRASEFSQGSFPSVPVSVIIACKNEEKRVPGLLDSLRKQNYPAELLEIIFVDDNSTDNTSGVIRDYGLPGKVRLIRNQGKGKKAALMTGIEAASGILMITTDADCSMGSDWIMTIASFHGRSCPDLIIAPVILTSPRGFFGKFQELEFLSLQGITAGTLSSGAGIMCNGANLAFTKESYLRSKHDLHFEHPSGDDVFMLHSLKKDRSSRIYWLESKEATVTTRTSETIKSFLSQRNRWISKWHLYDDLYTILIAVFTLIAVIVQLAGMIAACLIQDTMLPFLTIFILKSVPDFMIIHNRASAYGKAKLMWWFIPAQIVYPVYVMAVIFTSPFRRNWN